MKLSDPIGHALWSLQTSRKEPAASKAPGRRNLVQAQNRHGQRLAQFTEPNDEINMPLR